MARMDKPIAPEIIAKRRWRRWLNGFAVALVLGIGTFALSRLKPAAPRVEKSSVWIDTVKRGEMLREVRGNGTLVPEEVRWIPAINTGRIEKILVLPGAAVKPDTVLVELSSPELELAALEAESQLKAAKAELTNLRAQLESQRLTLEAAVATARANYSAAKEQVAINEELDKHGLMAAFSLRQSRTKQEDLNHLWEIEQERLEKNGTAASAQIDAQTEKIAQLTGLFALKQRHVEGQRIRAGMEGVLQRLGDVGAPLQIGQQLTAGALVARVASQTRLKAAIKIPETQARDIQLEQPARIDTRNGIVTGHVTRIDPAVENGAVTVDAALDGPIPKGARPDLSVDGIIELERLNDVLFVGRPAQGQPDSTVRLFKLIDDGSSAVQTPVRLGRTSVSSIEIVQGLEPGDRIILSDMSNWSAQPRVRLQ